MNTFHIPFTEVAAHLNVDIEKGLTHEQVADRRRQYGENALPKPKKRSFWVSVYHQFAELLSLILIAAAVISFLLGDIKDAVVIGLIVVANGVMGLVQQAKAENALAALEKMSVDEAVVLREGEVEKISTRELVPGDIILLDAGSKIPADARLFDVAHLQVTESALTGESRPVEKSAEPLRDAEVTLGDRVNMVYKDSIVNYGRARAIVTATGQETEIGKISKLLSGSKNTQTRLEVELERVGKVLTLIAGVAAIVVFFAIYFLVELPIKEVLFTAISLAIAVVPEGIPVVITTVLAVSVTKLAHKNAIIRKMSAVETLGAVTHILTDKTGTLTMNEMRAVHANIGAVLFEIDVDGKIRSSAAEESQYEAQYDRLLECAVLCNDAEYRDDGLHIGDPTETALLVAAKENGISLEQLRKKYTRIEEVPFSSDRKKMTVVVEDAHGNRFAFTKGAAEAVVNGQFEMHAQLLEDAASLARNGIRTLAFSMRKLDAGEPLNEEGMEKDHEILGLLGLKDPLRSEVKAAVQAATTAGVQTIMITGDHMLIAANIGKELGIIENDTQVMDGSMLGDASADEIAEALQHVRVFSRVSPEQKLKIVQAVQASGAVVAVTGDGVNDAPAIKTADIGIAMGITGTDVTKEVAEIVLRDDNYSTIVQAIAQGRVIFSNFVKFLRYQISCNLSGVFVLLFPALLGLHPPLIPIHILILNLFSETGPSIALGLEKGEKDVMVQPPRSSSERLLNRKRWLGILAEAVLLAAAALATFWFAHEHQPAAIATATMTTAFLSRLWHAFSSRSEHYSIFSRRVAANHWLEVVILFTVIIYGFMVYTTFGNRWFATVALDMKILLVSVLFSFVPVIGVELLKIARRARAKNGV